ncbi:MAG: MerR family transcriptional regulator [Bacilli bacterium]
MAKNDLFKIAEVAKFLGVSTTTLRYYEQYGFIKPAKVDEMTGYRYYNINNIGEITHIIDMRRSGLSMRQIKSFFESKFDIHAYINDLKKKRATIDKQIKINELRFLDNDTYSINYINTRPTFCLKREAIAKGIEDIEEQLSSFLLESLKKGYVLDGYFMTLIEFDSIIPKFKNIKIKMYIMVKQQTDDCEIFPAINGIHTYHRGNYESIGNAYKALCSYAQKHHINLKGNAMENYFRSCFAVSDEGNMLTEVILPIENIK